MRPFTDADVLLAMLAGGASALASVFVGWHMFGIAISDNMMDWRAGIRRALAGTNTGVRFTLCYAARRGNANVLRPLSSEP